MKVTLPIIGQVKTGKDSQPEVIEKIVEKEVEKLVTSQLGAGFLDLTAKSDYKTVSTRLLKAYEGWVFANVSTLAEEISKIEFELYKTVMKGGVMELVQVEEHPLLDLLDKFNPFTTTSQAMYVAEAQIELAGDTFFLLDGGNVDVGENIKNIFILQPDMVEVVPGDEGTEYEIKQYKYKYKNDKGETKEIVYEANQVIQIKTPNPSNPLRGKSVVEAAAIDIDTDNLAGEMIMKFFQNGAIPSVVLSTEQRLGKDDVQRIQTDLKKTYGGIRNFFKTMILGNGLTPVTIQQSAKEMEFLEIEKAMRDKIMAMFKNTPASLGIIEDVNRANAEATILSWKESTIKPKMQRIVDTLNEFLVPRFGDNLILTFEDPVPENRQDDIDEATALYEAGIMTLNEAREEVDLDPVANGDDFKNSNAQVPVTPQEMPKNLYNVDYKKHFRRSKTYTKLEEHKKLFAEAKKIAEKKLKPKKKAAEVREHPIYTNTQVWKYHNNKMKMVDNRFDNFKTEVDKFITGLEEKSIDKLHDIVDKKVKKKAYDLFDTDAEIAAGIDLFTPLLEEIGKLSGSEVYALMKLGGVYIPSPDYAKIIAKNVEEFVTSVVGTDKEKLSNLLAEGLKEGQSIAEIERLIRSSFSDYKKNQSEKVARTEILRASNEGTLDAFKASDVVVGKQWLTAMDDRVDPECADLNGKIVELEGNFFKTDYGTGETPPLHPNCRCDLLPVLVDTDPNLAKAVKAEKELEKVRQELTEEKEYSTKLEKIAGVSDEQD